jgi:hypothetical protein
MEIITTKEAEQIAGRKLDGRRKYATTDDGKPDEMTGATLFEIGRWTRSCSGCSCDGEYPCDCCQERGAGCHECGYTGKRREEMWVPVLEPNAQ